MGETPTSPDSPPTPDIDWSFIWKQEGGVLSNSYIPAKTSGVTVGPGFDIGQHTSGEIDKLKLSDALEEKLKKFAAYGSGNPRNAINDAQLAADYNALLEATQSIKEARKKLQTDTKEVKASRKELAKAEKELKKLTTAQKETGAAEEKVLAATQKLQGSEAVLEQSKETLNEARQTFKKAKTENSYSFELTPEETTELTNAVIADKEAKFTEVYNKAVEAKEAEAKSVGTDLKLKRFHELPASVQTAIASFQFNRGEKRGITGSQEEKAFWNAAVEQKDWKVTADLLKATHLDKGFLKTRRNEEADYLIQSLPKQEKDQSLNDFDQNPVKLAQKQDANIKPINDKDIVSNQIKEAFGIQPTKNQAAELDYWKERFGSEEEKDKEEKEVKVRV